MLNKIFVAIKQRLVFTKLINYFLIKLGMSNKIIADQSIRCKVYNRMKKKYSKLINKVTINKEYGDMSNKIWICWLQGIENAPDIVKKCYESVKKQNIDKKIEIIDKSNFEKFVQLPKYIIEKWKKGIISNAHFSDLLRMELLINYGGIWLDATVYCTDKIPEYILSEDLFVYQIEYPNDNILIFGNWLISSRPGNKLLITTRDLLYEYWRKHNIAEDYFIMQMMFSIVTQKYKEEWKKVPFYSHRDCHILARELFNKFTEKRYGQIKQITPIHKLSNKLTIPDNIEDTFYDKLIKGVL